MGIATGRAGRDRLSGAGLLAWSRSDAGRVNIHGTMARTDYPGRLDRLTDMETTSMRTGVTTLAGVLAMILTIGPTAERLGG